MLHQHKANKLKTNLISEGKVLPTITSKRQARGCVKSELIVARNIVLNYPCNTFRRLNSPVFYHRNNRLEHNALSLSLMKRQKGENTTCIYVEECLTIALR